MWYINTKFKWYEQNSEHKKNNVRFKEKTRDKKNGIFLYRCMYLLYKRIIPCSFFFHSRQQFSTSKRSDRRLPDCLLQRELRQDLRLQSCRGTSTLFDITDITDIYLICAFLNLFVLSSISLAVIGRTCDIIVFTRHNRLMHEIYFTHS